LTDPSRVRFGLFEFDPATCELTREGIAVRLQPQPARVLLVLVAQPQTVVSRESLRRQIWPDGTFVDFERGLNFCIAQIRTALGDSADSPRFIETVPRRGYRFIAPVATVEPARSARADNESRPSQATPVPLRRRRWWFAGVAVGTAAGLILIAVLSGAGSRPSPIRVAVVPFDNESADPSLNAVASGIADLTVARLAAPERLRTVSVVGNAAALRRPRAFRDVKAIGQEVHVDYVVLAQVTADPNGTRVIAHLIRTDDESHVWANAFVRPVFGLDQQSEVAESIAQSVVSRLARR
jgi:DNA-binding winged helix-turn-helix (wHTH) protein/TolB-like protein